jgi:tyrocidine synthetase-3
MTVNPSIDNIADIYPLVDVQKGMVFHTLKDPNGGVYHNQMVLGFAAGNFDFQRFKKALALLVEKHSILRTGFDLSSFDEPLQIVYKTVEPDVEAIDLCALDNNGKHSRINHFLFQDRAKPFLFKDKNPPWRMRIFVMDPNNICLVWICHHAIIDGWSNAIFLGELQDTYHHLRQNPGYRVSQLKCSYKDFVLQQVAQKKKPEIAEFWKKELQGFKRLEFGVQPDNRPAASPVESFRLALQPDISRRLGDVAHLHNSSVKNVFFAAYVLMLAMLSYDNDIVAGVVTNTRPILEDGDKLVGCFLNTVPVRIQVPGTGSYASFIQLIEEKMVALKQYDRLPFQEISRYAGNTSSDENPVFDTLFNFVDYKLYTSTMGKGKGGDTADEPAGQNRSQGGNGQFLQEHVTTNTSLDFHIDYSADGAIVSITIDTARVPATTARRLLDYFTRLVQTITRSPRKILSKSALLSEENKRKILHDFNDTAADFPQQSTISSFLSEACKKYPDRTAVGVADQSLTYSQLDERVNRAAALIRRRCGAGGAIVAVMMNRSIQLMVGILATQRAGAAYLPIDPSYPIERIRFILQDAGVKLALAAETFKRRLEDIATILDLSTVEWNQAYDPMPQADWQPSSLAYVIYTSGSTGVPKGVAVQQRSVVNQLTWMQRAYPLTEEDVVLQKTPIIFDVSVWELFLWMLSGASLYLLGAGEEKDPSKIIDVVQKRGVTHIHFVPSMLASFLEYLDSSGEAHRMSRLRRVFASGEALLVNHSEEFFRLLGNEYNITLSNLYGPTEGTVHVTMYDCDGREGDAGEVSIGKPVDNYRVYILDKHLQLLDIGVSGELCIGGDGLAAGYLNRMELTDQRFVQVPSVPGRRLYRTGDLAQMTAEGTIRYLGRLDHQVKIRGYRIELGEIEKRCLDMTAIKDAVAIALPMGKNDGDSQIAVYLVPDKHQDQTPVPEVEEFLKERLPGYMIPHYIIFLESLPLLTNGKIDRKALPHPEGRVSGGNYVPPQTEEQKKLVELWQEILGAEGRQIGIRDNFFNIGGHSLALITLISRIHKRLGIRLQMTDIFNNPTIEGQSEKMKKKEKEKFFNVAAVEKKEYYQLSAAQQRLFILQQLDPQSTVYHLPQVVTLAGDYKREKIQQVLQKLIQRHESLRTSFHSINGNPVQKIHDSVDFELDYYDFLDNDHSNETFENTMREFHRPFSLAGAPLLRALLVRSGEFSFRLMVDMHHIIADGVSLELLTRDFESLFSGDNPGELAVQYKDYADWQTGIRADGGLKSQEDFWKETFADYVPVLRLPYDFPRPAVKSYEGEAFEFKLQSSLSEKLKAYAERNGVTLFILLLSFVNVLLARLSGQEDIVVGTPVAGRRHEDLEPIIGMFVNTVPLRNFPREDKPFDAFLEELKERTIQAFENQEYPFEDIVDTVDSPRDISRNPLFDVMFTWQELTTADNRTSQKRQSSKDFVDQEFMPQQVKFDMTILSREMDEGIWFEFQYSTRLFKRDSIERFAIYFQKMTAELMNDGASKLGHIEILPTEEKRAVLSSFNDTARDFPQSISLWDMVASQVEKTPANPAILFEDRRLTYRELASQAQNLGNKIMETGGGRHSIVALLTDTAPSMVIAMCAILQTGAAFLPIDISSPNERIRFLMEDSRASLVVCNAPLAERIAKICDVPVIDVDKIDSTGNTPSIENVVQEKGEGLAYVMYTSGSTGAPKGVAVSHRNIVNQLHGLIEDFHFDSTFKHILMAPYTFDPSVQQIFMPLASGGSLTLASDEVKKDPVRLQMLLTSQGVNIFNTVPSLMEMLLETADTLDFRMIILAGEAFSRELRDKLSLRCPGCQLINIYGPTEATINTTAYRIPEQDDNEVVSIGKPMANYQVYVLNKSLRPVPINAPGELCVSGEGIARGYLNHPELTAQSFVPHPFVPGATLYRTGDLAKWREDGNLEFLGRIDHQIKIRGMRVEAGEVEKAINRHPDILEAVVLSEKRGAGRGMLTAYIVSAGQEELTLHGIRGFLLNELPEFMIPSQFHMVDHIPLNKNGKIDQKALLKMSNRMHSNEERVPPANRMETVMAGIWQEVLELDEVGVHDNFFDLGGNSLDIVKVSHRLGEELDVQVRVMDLFRYTTIRSFCEYLAAGDTQHNSESPETTQEALDRAQDSLDDALGFFQEDE